MTNIIPQRKYGVRETKGKNTRGEGTQEERPMGKTGETRGKYLGERPRRRDLRRKTLGQNSKGQTQS